MTRVHNVCYDLSPNRTNKIHKNYLPNNMPFKSDNPNKTIDNQIQMVPPLLYPSHGHKNKPSSE